MANLSETLLFFFLRSWIFLGHLALRFGDADGYLQISDLLSSDIPHSDITCKDQG